MKYTCEWGFRTNSHLRARVTLDGTWTPIHVLAEARRQWILHVPLSSVMRNRTGHDTIFFFYMYEKADCKHRLHPGKIYRGVNKPSLYCWHSAMLKAKEKVLVSCTFCY
ncbi:hypothetical protein GDO78_003449 [Eleutherodactylus coqui]|uniref:Uncharacterized protein n=1 Tax=Eleutherodactylus coqui TaxID=57060 RepID=A0A8J6EU07_ELECQ|nr:hypothetical protein GDO78_003449 [Eleutherodactylus coqui]